MARTSSKIVNNIPSSETGSRTTCITKSNDRYIITNCIEKQRFTLWKELDDGFEKIATADPPLDFDSMIPYDK